MKKIEKFLDKYISPIATWMSNSKFFSALSEAFMRTTAITIGASFLLIIGNFPIPAWLKFLETSGLNMHFTAVMGASMNALSLFIVFNFAYVYAKNENLNGLTSGILALGSFLILMPQTIPGEGGQPLVSSLTGKTAEGFQTMYTGGTGLFVAIIVGYTSARLFLFFTKKNIVVKLPESVPTNVSESLSPAILSGLIFTIFFVVRLLFASLPKFGFPPETNNIFVVILALIQQPLQQITSSPITIILVLTLANILWFFGIHPNMVYAVLNPILLASLNENMNAYSNGEPLPFLLMAVMMLVCGNGFGGQGATYGLVISMFTAKSERYKQLRKLAAPPSIFNINEPLIFGMPIMMNPLFFLPMILCPPLMGSTAWILVKLLNFTNFNPMVKLPWTTPAPIVMGLQGGVKYLLIFAIVLVVNILIWFPFFKIADNEAIEEEKNLNISNHTTEEQPVVAP